MSSWLLRVKCFMLIKAKDDTERLQNKCQKSGYASVFLMIDKLKASFEICHFFITPYAVSKSFCGVKIIALIKF